MHKAFCETSVREPMAVLPGELSGEFDPGPIARPHRDVRFVGRSVAGQDRRVPRVTRAGRWPA